MKAAEPLWSSNDGWRKLHHITDEMLSKPDLNQQVEFIQDELEKITGYPTRLFLTEDYKPLPQESVKTDKDLPTRNLIC